MLTEPRSIGPRDRVEIKSPAIATTIVPPTIQIVDSSISTPECAVFAAFTRIRLAKSVAHAPGNAISAVANGDTAARGATRCRAASNDLAGSQGTVAGGASHVAVVMLSCCVRYSVRDLTWRVAGRTYSLPLNVRTVHRFVSAKTSMRPARQGPLGESSARSHINVAPVQALVQSGHLQKLSA